MQNGFENAIDADVARRPGVPEAQEPHAVGAAHWKEPPQQGAQPNVLKDAQRRELTATYGTGPNPRLLSGALRRAAYQLPDYRVWRWLMLLVADRIDAIESAVLRPFAPRARVAPER